MEQQMNETTNIGDNKPMTEKELETMTGKTLALMSDLLCKEKKVCMPRLLKLCGYEAFCNNIHNPRGRAWALEAYRYFLTQNKPQHEKLFTKYYYEAWGVYDKDGIPGLYRELNKIHNQPDLMMPFLGPIKAPMILTGACV